MTSNRILEQISEIREYVNAPRKHYGLFQNKPMFFQLSSSMDVIEDTESAINAFTNKDFGNSNKNELYLGIYGLLQAIYLQQDAVINLCDALSIKEDLKNYPKLIEIRGIRNDSVGHPTKRDVDRKKKIHSYNFITQMSMSKGGFELLSQFSNGEHKHKFIQINELITNQHSFISDILIKVVEKLQQEEQEHKAKYRGEILMELFPSTTSYYIEKLRGGVYSEHQYGEVDVAVGIAGLEQLVVFISNFKEAVQRRDISFHESLIDEYELIDFAVTELKNFLEAKAKGTSIEKPNKLKAIIFCKFIENEISELKAYAKQLDDEYAE